jgi:SAM-dependent methyltransferase
MSSTTVSPQAPDCDHLWREVYGDLQRFGPAHFHERRLAERLLDRLDYRSVLDVGCGPGWNLARLTSGRSLEPGAVAGLDLSPIALEQARRRLPEARLWVHDIAASAPSGQWDLVHCSLVLHLIPDDVAALRHLRACTGRHLYLSTMGGDFARHRPWEERLGAVRNYGPGELEAKLATAGFRVREFLRWGFPFYSPLARTLQNHSGGAGEGAYGPLTRLVAWSLRGLFHLNSTRRGDVLIVLAEPEDRPQAGREAA